MMTLRKAAPAFQLATFRPVCDDQSMRWTLAVVVTVLGVGLGGPVFGQTPVEVESAQPQAPHFEIVPPSPATRDATKPNDADFYRDDVRVRHEPAFIEPMQCKPVTELPLGEKWTFEIKFDGYRCIAVKRAKEVMLKVPRFDGQGRHRYPRKNC